MSKTNQAIVVLHVNGGVVNRVQSNVPVRVIILDEDTDGADEDDLSEIQGDEVYVIDRVLSEPDPDSDGVNIQEVLDIAAEVDCCN